MALNIMADETLVGVVGGCSIVDRTRLNYTGVSFGEYSKAVAVSVCTRV